MQTFVYLALSVILLFVLVWGLATMRSLTIHGKGCATLVVFIVNVGIATLLYIMLRALFTL